MPGRAPRGSPRCAQRQTQSIHQNVPEVRRKLEWLPRYVLLPLSAGYGENFRSAAGFGGLASTRCQRPHRPRAKSFKVTSGPVKEHIANLRTAKALETRTLRRNAGEGPAGLRNGSPQRPSLPRAALRGAPANPRSSRHNQRIASGECLPSEKKALPEARVAAKPMFCRRLAEYESIRRNAWPDCTGSNAPVTMPGRSDSRCLQCVVVAAPFAPGEQSHGSHCQPTKGTAVRDHFLIGLLPSSDAITYIAKRIVH